MKRTERHHLKDNEFAQLAAGAANLVQDRSRTILGVVVALVVVAVGIGGYTSWRNSAEARAATQLASALTIEEARVGPPAAFGQAPSGISFVSQREKNQAVLTKYKEVADAFPNSQAGLYARHRQGATAMALGTPKLAVEAYQDVISKGGDSLYAQMAKLGLAEAQAQSGDYESAINTFRDLTQRKDGPLPVDGLLMRLGRLQIEAGKSTDAEQSFSKVVAEYPESSFAADARKELDALKKQG